MTTTPMTVAPCMPEEAALVARAVQYWATVCEHKSRMAGLPEHKLEARREMRQADDLAARFREAARLGEQVAA